MKRIVVGGSISSGKSTLSKILSKRLSIQNIELDEFFWSSNWKIRPLEEFKFLAREAVSSPSWILCGNYSVLRPVIWSKVDTVVWLDYPFWLCFLRCFKRSIINILKKNPVCNGNYESFSRLFLKKESILWWLIRTFRSRNKKYESAITDPKYSHIKFIRLKSQKETDRWIESLK